MKDERPDVVGAVLAGGSSTRMGSPKHALALSDGRTMLEHVVAALRDVCSDVVVLGNVAVGDGLRCIPDHRPGAGPLAGVEALLCSDLAAQYLVCPCDVPLVTSALLQQLLSETTAVVTVFRVAGRERFESLPMRISAGALEVLHQSLDAGKRSVQGFAEEAGYTEVVIDEDAARQLRNINTPDDVAAIHLR